jgi:hypothetical protein
VYEIKKKKVYGMNEKDLFLLRKKQTHESLGLWLSLVGGRG